MFQFGLSGFINHSTCQYDEQVFHLLRIQTNNEKSLHAFLINKECNGY